MDIERLRPLPDLDAIAEHVFSPRPVLPLGRPGREARIRLICGGAIGGRGRQVTGRKTPGERPGRGAADEQPLNASLINSKLTVANIAQPLCLRGSPGRPGRFRRAPRLEEPTGICC